MEPINLTQAQQIKRYRPKHDRLNMFILGLLFGLSVGWSAAFIVMARIGG